jgi:hypothetical protein
MAHAVQPLVVAGVPDILTTSALFFARRAAEESEPSAWEAAP